MVIKNRWLMAVWVLLVSLVVFECAGSEINYSQYLQGDYWRRQALEDIIPFWVNTLDKKGGGYFTDIDRTGVIGTIPLKYPRMVSRLIFGFNVAYLLSGDEKYLFLAKHGNDYLQKYGWDSQYGGWFIELNVKNQPTVPIKVLFDETYGNVGPVFYYYATGNQQALDLVTKTHRLIKGKAWDSEYQGYYGAVEQDWSVSDTEKSFNSQIDTATAYLIYYYLNTKDPSLLDDLREIGNVAVERMYDPDTGYIRENYTRKWDYLGSDLGDQNQVDIGHNLKTAWVLLRLYQLTGDEKYLNVAKKLSVKLLTTAWDSRYYGWYFTKNVHQPVINDKERIKCWWTQTEGGFMLLNMYNITKDPLYLDYFQKNAYFWDQYMVDHKYKEVYPYVSDSGIPDAGSNYKANLYKSAYHSMENALMNYLYLQLYVQHQTAELHFLLSASKNGTKHYVKIIEDPAVIIKEVELNGKRWERFNPREGYLILPKGDKLKVRVVLDVVK
jgi:mannose/cellobiose epimerase-like protein (N-acyl-D-glucosamine 2-epimerase family)